MKKAISRVAAIAALAVAAAYRCGHCCQSTMRTTLHDYCRGSWHTNTDAPPLRAKMLTRPSTNGPLKGGSWLPQRSSYNLGKSTICIFESRSRRVDRTILIALAAIAAATIALAAPAQADPDDPGSDTPSTTDEVCGAFNLGVPPGDIPAPGRQ